MRNMRKSRIIKLLTCFVTVMSLLLTTGCMNGRQQGGPVNGGNRTQTDSGEDDQNQNSGADDSSSAALSDGDSSSGTGDNIGTDTDENSDDTNVGGDGSDGGHVAVGPSGNSVSKMELTFADQPDVPYTWIYTEKYFMNKYSDDYLTTLINSSYELLQMCDEAREAYPELAKALDSTNEFLANGQKELYKSDENYVSTLTQEDIDNSIEYGLTIAGYDMSIFLRRADGDVLSFVCCTDRKNAVEWVYHDYMGFSFDMHTGKRIQLEDIASDKEALLDLLTSKAIDAANKFDSGFNGYETEYDPEQIKNLIKQSLEGGGVSWTLDPQGITFYFNTFNLVARYLEVPVFFSEDKDGKIFNGKFPEPNYWVTYIQPSLDVYFDAEDDGKIDYVNVIGAETWDDAFGYQYSLNLAYNDKFFNTELDMVSSEKFMLVHEPLGTWLYMYYSSFDTSCLDIYELSENGPEVLQQMYGRFTMPMVDYMSSDAGYYCPVFTDPTNINMNIRTDVLSTCHSAIRFNLERDGSLTRMDSVYNFLPEYQWTITSKLDFYHLSIVDEDGNDTGYVTDIPKGSKVTLLRTDNSTYCDVVDENAEIVRIPVTKNGDYSFLVHNDDKDIYIYEAFEDTMFGQ